MATLVGTQKEIKSLVTELIELDYDAIEAYKLAVDRLEDEESRRHLKRFMEDHERHVRELGAVMRAHGHEPPNGGDIKQLLTKGKVYLADLTGDDRAILEAMKSNEDDTNTAYERTVARNDLSADLRQVVERNLQDERLHREWIVRRLDSLIADEEGVGSILTSDTDKQIHP